jgi:hypothetical protein
MEKVDGNMKNSLSSSNSERTNKPINGPIANKGRILAQPNGHLHL